MEAEIIISDSDTTSSDPIIEVDTTDEEIQESLVIKKRPRGRPPKNTEAATNVEKSTVPTQNIVKRPRGRPPKMPRNNEDKIEEITIIIKTNHRCSKCPKSFPSEGSLNSHMKCHIFELPSTMEDKFDDHINETATATNMRTKKAEFNRYICDKCGEMFKNTILLTRHLNSHNEYCTACKKYFSSQSELNVHKRVHVKEQMVKETILPLHTPKRYYSIIKRKSPVKRNVKCTDCGRIVPLSLLERHKKFHRKYICRNCKMEFFSWLLLSKHIATNCVVRRNLLANTSKHLRRSLGGGNRPVKSQNVAPNCSKFTQSTKPTSSNIKCGSYQMTFATHTSLYKHKETKHSYKEVDKNLIRKSERLCKENVNRVKK